MSGIHSCKVVSGTDNKSGVPVHTGEYGCNSFALVRVAILMANSPAAFHKRIPATNGVIISGHSLRVTISCLKNYNSDRPNYIRCANPDNKRNEVDWKQVRVGLKKTALRSVAADQPETY